MLWRDLPRRKRSGWAAAGLCVLLPLGCSLLAPPDSELVGTRPEGQAGGGTGATGATGGTGGSQTSATGGIDAEGGAAGAPTQDMGGNSPGKPTDVGTPTGDWVAGPGLKTRFAAEVDASSAHQDYPRPRLTRHTWATLNGLWQYVIDPSGATPPTFSDAVLLVPFPLESKLSGVQGGLLNATDFLWYRRSFTVPAAWRSQRLLLHFGAVDWEASVRINGTEVVAHTGGYDGFSADITDQLVGGEEQQIVVRVDDPTDSGTQPHGKQALVPSTGTSFSSVSGIWQSVWLEPVPTLSIQNVDFDGDPKTGVVNVTPTLSGKADGTIFRAIVRDAGAEVVRAEGKDGAAFTVTVPAPVAWTPDAPHLYDVTLELEQGGVVVDTADSYFGLRSLALGADNGATKVLLNDQAFVGMGVLYQGYWPEGLYTPPNDAAVKADLTLAKTLGFNTIRVHEKLESERFYYWADQLGLLVWQDMPSGDNGSAASQTTFSGELSAMVSERRSHPSLAVWTLFTEGLGQTGADVGKLVSRVKALTPSQLVIGAAGGGDDGSGDIRDRPENGGFITSPVPDARAVAVGQYGSLNRAIQGHTWGGSGAAAQTAADTARYVDLARRARGLAQSPGLSTSVYRQLTDVENELDGLATYDRQVTKVVAKTITEANVGMTSPIVPLIQASEFELNAAYVKDAQIYRYTLNAPAAAWPTANFDDTTWTPAPAGIGDTIDAGARTRTKVSFGEIWTRTTFTLDKKPSGSLIVRAMYDEDSQVYVNGILASDLYAYQNHYADYMGSDSAAQALVAGKNTIAVHTINNDGGRYIDVGLWMTDDAPDYRVPDMPAATTAGLSYADYDVTLSSLPADISTNAPRQIGTSSTIGSYAPALAADGTRALRFHGYVEVAEDGIYTFFVDTDDGARLSIGTVRVAESTRNDGTNITKRAGNIALGTGKHEITIDYFANDTLGANSFSVGWAGPGFGQQSIPAGNLSH